MLANETYLLPQKTYSRPPTPPLIMSHLAIENYSNALWAMAGRERLSFRRCVLPNTATSVLVVIGPLSKTSKSTKINFEKTHTCQSTTMYYTLIFKIFSVMKVAYEFVELSHRHSRSIDSNVRTVGRTFNRGMRLPNQTYHSEIAKVFYASQSR